MMLSVGEAADRLGASTDEIIDAAGLTLGELEHAAGECGLIPERYREVPILSESAVAVLAGRIVDSRLPI